MLSPLSEYIHARKYRDPGETFEQAMERLVRTLMEGEREGDKILARDMLMSQSFMPAGRIQAAVGSTKKVTPYNCFVSGAINDSFVHGSGSIMDRAKEAATTMRMGGGIGYDFSTLRPRGAPVRGLSSQSSGPISFMDIFNAVCLCTASTDQRRGAQMGVMRVDHPDILEFVRAKQNSDRLTGFNTSVAVTDAFMNAVEQDHLFPLVFGGVVHSSISARYVWDEIMRSTYDWAEPGVLFIDRINQMNNLRSVEEIAATNPCGEQPLPPFGACLLGSFNLPKYVRHDGLGYNLRYSKLALDVSIAVRMMDRVVDVANYPLPEQEDEAKAKRRMGLGVTGLANAVEALGHPYGSPGFVRETRKILNMIARAAYLESAELAKERGAFPLFEEVRDDFLTSPFVQRLGIDVVNEIGRKGIRNSHLTSIAPTGTISLCADNVSSGIEPVFGYQVAREVRTALGVETLRLGDYGFVQFGVRGKLQKDVTVEEHVAVLEAAQAWVDSSVSKTVNVPGEMDFDAFKDVYRLAWSAGAKGCTTYRVGGKRAGILTAEEGASCKIDAETGRRECS